jgi:hypothetical protein
MRLDRVRVVLALLLLASAALFVAGSIAERGHTEPRIEHKETGGEKGTEGREATQTATTAERSERLFGLDLERPGLVAAAAGVTVALAGAALGWRRRGVLWAILAFAVAFMVLDVREVVHQSSEGRTSIVVVAAILAGVHLAIAALALVGGARDKGRSMAVA